MSDAVWWDFSTHDILFLAVFLHETTTTHTKSAARHSDSTHFVVFHVVVNGSPVYVYNPRGARDSNELGIFVTPRTPNLVAEYEYRILYLTQHARLLSRIRPTEGLGLKTILTVPFSWCFYRRSALYPSAYSGLFRAQRAQVEVVIAIAQHHICKLKSCQPKLGLHHGEFHPRHFYA